MVEYPLHVCKLFWSRSDIMHVAIAWDSKPLLLLTTALLPNRTTESFQMEAGPPYDKQRIQMGLRKGNIVLIYFRSGVVHYQCVLIATCRDRSPTSSTLWCSKISITLETPKVPKNWRSFCACLEIEVVMWNSMY